MSIKKSSIVPKEVFGVQGSLGNGVQFLNEVDFMYVASHCLVKKNLVDMKAPGHIISGSSSMCGISAITLSLDKKILAIAEFAKIQQFQIDEVVATINPTISIYSTSKLSKMLTLISTLLGSHKYVSLSFTCDGKQIAALVGSLEWELELWHVVGTKVVNPIKIVTTNHTIPYQVQCCPSNKLWLSVCGDGFAKTYKIVNNVMQQVSTEYSNLQGCKVLCQAWVPSFDVAEDTSNDSQKNNNNNNNISNGKTKDTQKAETMKSLDQIGKSTKDNASVKCACVYGLDSGELLHVDNGKIVARIPMQNCGDQARVAHSILQYSKGLICGESGAISMYDYDKALKTYRKVRSVKVEESNGRVCGLALSPTEDVLLCSLSSNHIIHLFLRDVDTMSSDSVSHLVHTQSYHQAFITGMDTCLLKPFVVTCSKDNSVRVWNYEEHSCEIMKFFPSEALSIAVHPTGLHLLLGFPDCLYLFDMLVNDLRVWREFLSVKGCTNCAFSRGGQYFAAATGTTVHIISTYTGHVIGHLRAHINKHCFRL
ncbi:uncharacterized protein [Physcomitrium patens]|uniref:uncharacterized protein isoform X2 n=1 Tax=Physcomitrium patens TaxID=3218 RepID=UPI003CCD6511